MSIKNNDAIYIILLKYSYMAIFVMSMISVSELETYIIVLLFAVLLFTAGIVSAKSFAEA